MMRERVRVLSQDPSKAEQYYRSNMQQADFRTLANRYGHALALIRTRHAGKALHELKPLLADHPSNLPLRLAMAEALSHAGQRDKALRLYADINAATPHNRAVLTAYAEALIADKSETR